MTGALMISSAAAIGVRLFVAGVLITSAHNKLSNRLEFQGVVRQYQLMPRGWEPIAATAVALLELAAAAALLLAPLAGATLAALLLAVYATAMAINLQRGRQHIDCGCGGDSVPLSPALVWRNISMVLLLGCIPLAASLNTPPRVSAAEASAGSIVLLGVGLAVALAALYLCYNQLQTNSGIYRRLWLGERVG